MSRTLRAALAAMLALPAGFYAAGAYAASEIDGTWKSDMSSWKATTPDEYLLTGGSFTCVAGCFIKQAVPADGADHATTGSPYSDAMAINVVDDHTVHEVMKKNGAKVAENTGVVSADGKTLIWTFSSTETTNGGPPVTGTSTETRVADGPAGSHAISGQWKFTGAAVSGNALETTYKSDGNTLTMSQPTGQSYTAVIDGPDAPFKGDTGVDMVAVKRVGPHVFEETDKLNGNAVWIGTSTISDDGKTMTTVWTDKRNNTGGSGVATKE